MTELNVLAHPEEMDLAARVPGKPQRIVLVGFYNYDSHALRIFHPLLERRGHEVHTIFFKNYFTYQFPTQLEEDMVVELVEKINPDLVGMTVWSTYYKLAARLTHRIRASVDPVVIWGGIHAQSRPENCLEHADIVARSEGEYVLAELTDRLSLGQDFTDLKGCWVRSNGEIVRNPPRLLIPDLDVLPPADMSPKNRYYLGNEEWRDVAHWDSQAVLYDIMAVRGCPFQCTFCIHNFTRKVASGLGTYVRRRSVDHVMAELHEALKARPNLQTVTFSDDIFAPPRPWLEEFCVRYKEEVGLPFSVYSYPGMVDEKRVRMMRDSGLWASVMGIQSGSARIRRECYERETSDEEILQSAEIFARHGVQRNYDFISDNPYETEEDKWATVNLLLRLQKPFFFNHFSLTFFPAVALTDRALSDGHIKVEDVEDVAEKGYRLYGGSLINGRSPEDLRWDVAYTMAVHGFPRWFVHRLLRSELLPRHIYRFVNMMRFVCKAARVKARVINRLRRTPDLLQQLWMNTNRKGATAELVVQPNYDSSPLSMPIDESRNAEARS